MSQRDIEARNRYPRRGTTGEMVRRIYEVTAMIEHLELEKHALSRYVSNAVASSTATFVVAGEPPLPVTVDGPSSIVIQESKVID